MPRAADCLVVSWVAVLLACGGARPAPATSSDASWRAFQRSVERAGAAQATVPVLGATVPPACELLPIETWATDPLLQIHEATTCRYRVTWLGWSPPRYYDYVPDERGWIRDYFIESAHGHVFWNLRTGEVAVRPISPEQPLDASSARAVAEWAQRTNFPGLSLTDVRLDEVSCTDSAPCNAQ